MKKCSTSSWDKEAKKAIGCSYVEWGNTEQLDEDCPQCGQKLVLYTTSSGKKMKKCSTSGWDKIAKKATGCPYVYWYTKADYVTLNQKNGEEFLPPEPEE